MRQSIIIFVLLGWVSLGHAAIWTEDFSGDLGKWQVTTVGGSTMSINSSNQLYMSSPGGSSSEAWAKPNDAFFNDWNVNLPYHVEFDFMIPNESNHWIFVYVDNRIQTVIDYNNDFKLRAGGVNTFIMDLAVNTWYSMLYVVTPATQTFDIYVNNIKQKTGGFANEPYFSPFYIGDRHSDYPDYGYAYWDNFQLTINIPEPASLIVWCLIASLGFAAVRLWRR